MQSLRLHSQCLTVFNITDYSYYNNILVQSFTDCKPLLTTTMKPMPHCLTVVCRPWHPASIYH